MITGPEIVESKVWRDAMKTIERGLFDAFTAANPLDLPELQSLSLKLWALREVADELGRELTRAERRAHERSAINDH